MRNVPAVARRDFTAYFCSPAGPAVAALFLALQGLVIWLFIQFLARPEAPPGGVMEFFFGGTILYWIAIAVLATVIPMRLLAEEIRAGTIEPLLTAPVTPADVVLGKWLAAVGFYLTLWAPTLLYLAYLHAIDAPLDPGPILSGYLGTVLVGCAALALGLFASSVTRNQLVAAALSFVAFFLILLLGVLEGQVGDPRVAAVLRRVSLFRMMEDFGHGIVDSRHVVMLATATALGLLATLRSVAALGGRAAALRGRVAGRLTRAVPPAVATVLALAIAVMVNYLAGRHYVRGDWTRARLYALSDKTVSVLRHLPRRVDAYVFLYPRRASEESRALAGMLRELTDRFARYAPDRFHVDTIDPDRDPARAEALQKRYGVGTYEMGDGLVILVSGEQSKFLTRDDLVEYEPDAEGRPGGRLTAWKGESAFVSALLTVTRDDPPTICFVKGHGEPDAESFEEGGYGLFAEDLRRDAYRTRTLDHLAPTPPPADCALLLIAEPQQAYTPAELRALDRYLDGGGRLLLMMGPTFNHDATAFGDVGLAPAARAFGITLGDNLVVDPAHASDVEGPSVWTAREVPPPAGPPARPGDSILARLAGRVTVWPRVREVRSRDPIAGARELFHSSDEGWGETDLATIRGERDLAFDPGRDVKGPVPVAAVAERASADGKIMRAAVFGTGRLVMNYRLEGPLVRDYDRDLVLSTVAWLTDREERSGVGPKVPQRVRLTLEAGTVGRAFRLFVIGLPLVCLALGALVWYRRRA
jgi:ABC-2 type transport system permease protein